MAGYFFDTSAIIKHYRQETGSENIDEILGQSDSSVFLSRLGVTETLSGLSLKVRTGELDPQIFALTRKKFLADIATPKFVILRLLVRHFRQANRLIGRYATARRLRTLDALQLSVALDLRDLGRIEHFVCADQPLCEVAELQGLSVINPAATP